MKITPFRLMICRTPAFPVANTLTDVWEELKEKIKTSSPTFYELIADKQATEIAQLNEKIQFTIWKYYNRSRYRATPFGSFASFSWLYLKDGSGADVQLQADMIEHKFTDWSEKDTYLDFKDILERSNFVFSNSTIYEAGEEIRYICFKNGQFQLASVLCFDELKKILDVCKVKTNLIDLYGQLQAEFDMDEASSKDLIEQMIALQLILTDLFPNITGEDYFKRTGFGKKNKHLDYILAERKLYGLFDQKKLKEIPDLVNCLQSLKPIQTSSNLQDFKTAFLKKFEDRHIPLAMAMDPEFGIGYGNLEQQFSTNDQIAILKKGEIKNNSQSQFKYTKLHSLLLNKIISGEEINLADLEPPKADFIAPLPNTFSIMFHQYKSKIVIESIGGCTANSLLGRFTLASNKLHLCGKEIAALENEVNPDVVFFDIAYQAEKNVDNVNRRKNCYTHELAILCWPTSLGTLELNDIMIAVNRNEIILSSKKLGKRLVPRISTAYNYTRSDLAVYRFLCDLQHQGIQSHLQFSLNEYFPGLQHYPRVYFKQVIVAPAQWLVPATYLKDKKEESIAEMIKKFKDWLDLRQISFPFKAGNGDLTLTFDPAQKEDLLAFLNYSKQQNLSELYITEALVASEDFIRDETQKGYAPQYIVNYYHKEQLYDPVPKHNSRAVDFRTATDVKIPGGDWLYFEIYCHPYRSNSILLAQIQKFLKQHQSLLKLWFFIRYNDPAYHIRLRLNVKKIDSIAILLQSFKNLIEPMLLSEMVKDVELKTYYRETKRYGATRIELVEQFFHLDSKLIFVLLRKAKTPTQLYLYGLETMQFFCDGYTNNIDQQIEFVKKVANNFAEEMKMDIEVFKKVNVNFSNFKREHDTSKHLTMPFVNSRQKMLHQILNNCTNVGEQEKMLADLIHMHINRLFDSEQRKHETILYHYLLKLLQAKRARLKQSLAYLC